MTLQLLLEHCASWIEKVDLNQEMPEIKFHVADTKGNKDRKAFFDILCVFFLVWLCVLCNFGIPGFSDFCLLSSLGSLNVVFGFLFFLLL